VPPTVVVKLKVVSVVPEVGVTARLAVRVGGGGAPKVAVIVVVLPLLTETRHCESVPQVGICVHSVQLLFFPP
jgi:hypothetical protein